MHQPDPMAPREQRAHLRADHGEPAGLDLDEQLVTHEVDDVPVDGNLFPIAGSAYHRFSDAWSGFSRNVPMPRVATSSDMDRS